MEQDLQEQLRGKSMSMGATYFGVADLAPASGFVSEQGGDFLSEYPIGVSVGVALADGLIDQLGHHFDSNVARTYRHHIYDFVGGQLDRLAGTMAFQIEQAGYRAIPVPSSGYYDNSLLKGMVSHKLVAHLAGLGWIGKSCLLITKAHGPRVRWATVLTDAPLPSTGGVAAEDNTCKSCTICVDLCPTHAFAGVAFNPGDPVEVRFDRWKCHEYLQYREKTNGARTCGVCVYVCPHGWSMKRKKNSQQTTPELLRQQLAGAAMAQEEVSQVL
ncbi:MAG: 4Fe-4S double cluster binding domain-containing protein [Dehalococcoidia bacterium]